MLHCDICQLAKLNSIANEVQIAGLKFDLCWEHAEQMKDAVEFAANRFRFTTPGATLTDGQCRETAERIVPKPRKP